MKSTSIAGILRATCNPGMQQSAFCLNAAVRDKGLRKSYILHQPRVACNQIGQLDMHACHITIDDDYKVYLM